MEELIQMEVCMNGTVLMPGSRKPQNLALRLSLGH